jgi:hypothetical protein
MSHAFRSLSLAVALLGASAAAAGEPATLESLVGPAEYQAMGLAKLSAEEQARLARWLRLRTAGQPVPIGSPTVSFGVDTVTLTATVAAAPAVAPAVADAPAAVAPPAAPAAKATVGTVESFGLPQDDVDGEIKEVRARIVGAFTGWDGQTTFKLDNGQVWRQSVSGTYRFKATDPEVVIEKGFLGYKLRLVETRRAVPVRRIK